MEYEGSIGVTCNMKKNPDFHVLGRFMAQKHDLILWKLNNIREVSTHRISTSDFYRRLWLLFNIWTVYLYYILYTQKKIFRNSSAAEDVVTEEYFEKFFCCLKISFARARIYSL
jgi:hypothetical protein